jgi:hypothetical protein
VLVERTSEGGCGVLNLSCSDQPSQPSFDHKHSTDTIKLEGDLLDTASCQKAPDSPDSPSFHGGYPGWNRDSALVERHTKNMAADVVHFKVTNPVYYFCISVSDKRPGDPPTKIKGNPYADYAYALSYYPDGDIHTYGYHARYRSETIDPARFKSDDIISVKVGAYGKLTPCPFKRVILAAPTYDKYPSVHTPIVAEKDVPYCIFYKNGKVMHDPFILPETTWPLYIGVYFTKRDEVVQIVDASSFGIQLEKEEQAEQEQQEKKEEHPQPTSPATPPAPVTTSNIKTNHHQKNNTNKKDKCIVS